MDRVVKYKELVTTLLEAKVEQSPENMPDVWHQLIIDDIRHQFILLAMGWYGSEFIHDWILHVELKEDKIWVYEDLSDPGIKVELLGENIPESDIVLAYLPDYQQIRIPDIEVPLTV